MTLPRRSALALFTAALAIPCMSRSQSKPTGAPLRAAGPEDAKVVVQEWFSLTCSHCAAFERTTFPQVKTKLIETGKIRYIWRAYPLDQVALMASMVARSLPAERFEPFIATLLATQDRWAFAPGVNSAKELAKFAALAGMPREAFDKAIADEALKTAILADQDEGQSQYGVNSTPTFAFNKTVVRGAIDYAAFAAAVEAAQG